MKKGFSQVEVLISVSLLVILFALGSVVLRSFARQDLVLAEVRKVKNVIEEARIKTVSGVSLGGGQGLNFGVYFQAGSYTIFSGTEYDSDNPNNQPFFLPDSLEFSQINLPSNQVVFDKITGEVTDYNSGMNNVVLSDNNSQQVSKISFNQLGTVEISIP